MPDTKEEPAPGTIRRNNAELTRNLEPAAGFIDESLVRMLQVGMFNDVLKQQTIDRIEKSGMLKNQKARLYGRLAQQRRAGTNATDDSYRRRSGAIDSQLNQLRIERRAMGLARAMILGVPYRVVEAYVRPGNEPPVDSISACLGVGDALNTPIARWLADTSYVPTIKRLTQEERDAARHVGLTSLLAMPERIATIPEARLAEIRAAVA